MINKKEFDSIIESSDNMEIIDTARKYFIIMTDKYFDKDLKIFNSTTGLIINKKDIIMGSIVTDKALVSKKLHVAYLFTSDTFYAYHKDDREQLFSCKYDDIKSVERMQNDYMIVSIHMIDGKEYKRTVWDGDLVAFILGEIVKSSTEIVEEVASKEDVKENQVKVPDIEEKKETNSIRHLIDNFWEVDDSELTEIIEKWEGLTDEEKLDLSKAIETYDGGRVGAWKNFYNLSEFRQWVMIMDHLNEQDNYTVMCKDHKDTLEFVDTMKSVFNMILNSRDDLLESDDSEKINNAKDFLCELATHFYDEIYGISGIQVRRESINKKLADLVIGCFVVDEKKQITDCFLDELGAAYVDSLAKKR